MRLAAENDEHLAAGAGDRREGAGAAQSRQQGRLDGGPVVDGHGVSRRGAALFPAEHLALLLAKVGRPHGKRVGGVQLSESDERRLILRRPRLADVVIARHVPAKFTLERNLVYFGARKSASEIRTTNLALEYTRIRYVWETSIREQTWSCAVGLTVH